MEFVTLNAKYLPAIMMREIVEEACLSMSLPTVLWDAPGLKLEMESVTRLASIQPVATMQEIVQIKLSAYLLMLLIVLRTVFGFRLVTVSAILAARSHLATTMAQIVEIRLYSTKLDFALKTVHLDSWVMEYVI
jgi:hypothetical protein